MQYPCASSLICVTNRTVSILDLGMRRQVKRVLQTIKPLFREYFHFVSALFSRSTRTMRSHSSTSVSKESAIDDAIASDASQDGVAAVDAHDAAHRRPAFEPHELAIDDVVIRERDQVVGDALQGYLRVLPEYCILLVIEYYSCRRILTHLTFTSRFRQSRAHRGEQCRKTRGNPNS